MEFRLLYSGRVLGSSRNNTRADLKHAIRREFHPQLRRLWNANHGLREMALITFQNHPNAVAGLEKFHAEHPNNELRDVQEFEIKGGLDLIGERWSRVGYKFVPLVTPEEYLRCSLDILFLRPDEPRFVIESGDLDARIKTVFDSLRLPNNLDETGGIGPQDDETPFFCLLADDKLVSEVRVNTDELLVLPKAREVNPNDAFLVIHVRIKPTSKPARFRYVFE